MSKGCWKFDEEDKGEHARLSLSLSLPSLSLSKKSIEAIDIPPRDFVA